MQSCMQIMLATDDVQLSSNTEDATGSEIDTCDILGGHTDRESE